MKKLSVMLPALLAFAVSLSLQAGEPKAYIISPKDGAVVNSPVTVVFGLKGMGVAPAGVNKANTGHHHLLVDDKSLPEPGKPMGNNVQHFGGGQTETQLTLSPGTHTLRLVLGDMMHVPIEPAVVSELVTITVK